MPRCRWNRWLVWLLAPLPLFLPLAFLPRLLFFGNLDALFYTNVLALTSENVNSGHLWIRWFAAANAGMGSTVMMFYAPLAYLSTAILEWPLGAFHLDIGARFVLGMYFAQVLSGAAAFAWLRNRFSARVALIGSVVYVLLPYKFVYIYLHFNLAQLWALVFLPLWMLAAEKLAAGGSLRAVAGFALAGAATYHSHPLTVLAFGIVPACYVVWAARGRMAVLGKLVLAGLLMAGLCLIAVLPQRHDLAWIHAEQFLAGKYNWRANLLHADVMLCAYYGPIAALVSWAAWRSPAMRKSGMASPVWFWSAAIAVVAFLNLHISAVVWQNVPAMQYLQFPAARLHCVALMGAVFLICVWLEHGRDMLPLSPRVYRRFTLWTLVAIFGAATALHAAGFYRHGSAPVDARHLAAMRQAYIVSPAEYQTRWGCADPGRALDSYRTGAIAPPVSAPAGTAVLTEAWGPPRRISFTAEVSGEQAALVVRQCYLPAWEASDSGAPLALAPGAPDGLIRLNLARGHHHIEIQMAAGPAVVWGRLGSAAALILCLCFAALRAFRPSS